LSGTQISELGARLDSLEQHLQRVSSAGGGQRIGEKLTGPDGVGIGAVLQFILYLETWIVSSIQSKANFLMNEYLDLLQLLFAAKAHNLDEFVHILGCVHRLFSFFLLGDALISKLDIQYHHPQFALPIMSSNNRTTVAIA
jgi:hypothetical protein